MRFTDASLYILKIFSLLVKKETQCTVHDLICNRMHSVYVHTRKQCFFIFTLRLLHITTNVCLNFSRGECMIR